MANEEHCRLLNEAANQELKQQGVGRELWNNWRIANPEVMPDLSGVVCRITSQGSGLSPIGSGIKLIGFDFSRTNLSNSCFSRPDFEGANFSQADLANVTLCWGNFSRANLQRANLKKANLNEADLGGADLSNADIKEAQLARANFKGAVLRGANLSGAILNRSVFSRPKYAKIYDTELSEAYNRASLRGANLSRAYLIEANLSGADLIKADLSEATLIEADLTDADLSEAKLIKTQLWGADLRSAFLTRTDLSGADLGEAKLSAAHFIGAILIEADLTMTEAVATHFKQAILTGACIEDWNISSQTNLDGVICDYVYLKRGQQERRPHRGSFVPGDFIKLVQDSLDTVDLIFNEGVNWKAFAYSFHNTQVENEGIPLAIRSIENKGDGVVLIRVTVPPDADKGKIHNDFLQGYEFAQKALESQYQARLEDKDQEINRLFYFVNQLQNQLGEVPKLMAEQSKYDQRGANISIGSYVDTAQSGSRQQGQAIQHNYAPEQKQTLAEAAAEIQQLLKQLEQTNPSATEAEKIEHINDETTPKFKKRVVGALQATGEAAIDEFVLENKYLKVVKAAVKGWIKPE